MTFEEFERLAHEMFDQIPEEYRMGVEGLVVKEEAPAHPELPEIYTLGECYTDSLPVDFPGPDDLHSFVVLYHGSFERIAERTPGFDWETEIWNTITHEIRHHLEYRAEEDALEVQDYAEEQNFARRDGLPFDPFFFRTGVPRGEDAYEVDGDLFVERRLTQAGFDRLSRIELVWQGGRASVPRPDRLGDVHFVSAEDHPWDRGDLVGVLVRRIGVWEAVRRLLAFRSQEVLHTYPASWYGPGEEEEGEGAARA